MSKVHTERITKVGAIIVSNNRILVVRKATAGNNTPIFIIPGGKIEKGESPLNTLKRELREELGVKIQSSQFFGSFSGLAVFEDSPIDMDVYVVTISGDPRPGAEIQEFAWIDKNYKSQGIEIGSILQLFVIPRLAAAHLL